jgi:SAM-dependent methyltransferase
VTRAQAGLASALRRLGDAARAEVLADEAAATARELGMLRLQPGARGAQPGVRADPASTVVSSRGSSITPGARSAQAAGLNARRRSRGSPVSRWRQRSRPHAARPPARARGRITFPAFRRRQGSRRVPAAAPAHTRSVSTLPERTIVMTAVAELKLVHRSTWAAGDYAAVARHIDESPPRDLLARMDIQAGQDVLDVATGTGNLAIRAAAAGARVVGLDLTPELFEEARARALAHNVVVDWVEGDAEELPYEDESFDRVLSAFGVQFAPRHEIVARELAGVTRPGGRIGLVNWTPEGAIGELFQIMGRYLPPPPEFASAPPLWGRESHVRRLFADSRVVLDFARGYNPWRFESPEAWVSFMETNYGPTLKARQRLEAEGTWEDCRAEMLAMARRRNEATDGSLLMRAEYLIAIGHKVGS